jgi:acyl-CoA thioester hydrolase
MAEPAVRRTDFTVLRPIATRWMDNDHYGHVNNVAYYSFFDTAVNGFLIEATGTDIRDLPAIGIVAESTCQFVSAISFPDTIHAGLAIERVGTSSIVYAIALFRGDDQIPCAVGRFVHVYVGRETRRPVPIPDVIRQVIERLK